MSQNSWFDPFYITNNLSEEELSIQKNIKDFCENELLIRVIEDNCKNIMKTVQEFHKAYTYVFTTGGIGPTHDDITSKYFIDKKQKARAYFLTEENIVLAGNNIVFYIFKKYCKNFKLWTTFRHPGIN